MSSVNTHHHHVHHHGYNNGSKTRGSNNGSSGGGVGCSSSSSLLQQQQQQQQSCDKGPPGNNSLSVSSSSSSSSSFLKIPRIRLKQKSSSSSSTKDGQKHPSPQQLQSPTENSKNILKFSYIENSHLVNPVMMMQQQQQQKSLLSKKQEQNRNSGDFSDEGDNDEEEQVFTDGNGGRVLIKPKKLPNPIKESVAMQSIHRELLLNQKIGRSVLNHKTELQKALEKLATKNILDSDNNDPSLTSSSCPVTPDYDRTGVRSPTSQLNAPHPPVPPMVLPKHSQMPVSLSSPSVPTMSSSQQQNNKNKTEFHRILEARAKQIEDQKCFVDGVTKHPVINESEFEKIHKRITSNVHK